MPARGTRSRRKAVKRRASSSGGWRTTASRKQEATAGQGSPSPAPNVTRAPRRWSARMIGGENCAPPSSTRTWSDAALGWSAIGTPKGRIGHAAPGSPPSGTSSREVARGVAMASTTTPMSSPTTSFIPLLDPARDLRARCRSLLQADMDHADLS